MTSRLGGNHVGEAVTARVPVGASLVAVWMESIDGGVVQLCKLQSDFKGELDPDAHEWMVNMGVRDGPKASFPSAAACACWLLDGKGCPSRNCSMSDIFPACTRPEA